MTYKSSLFLSHLTGDEVLLEVSEHDPGGVDVLVLLLPRPGLLVRDPDRPPAVGEDVPVPVLVFVPLTAGCLGVPGAVDCSELLQAGELGKHVLLAGQEGLQTGEELAVGIAMRKLEVVRHDIF